MNLLHDVLYGTAGSVNDDADVDILPATYTWFGLFRLTKFSSLDSQNNHISSLVFPFHSARSSLPTCYSLLHINLFVFFSMVLFPYNVIILCCLLEMNCWLRMIVEFTYTLYTIHELPYIWQVQRIHCILAFPGLSNLNLVFPLPRMNPSDPCLHFYVPFITASIFHREQFQLVISYSQLRSFSSLMNSSVSGAYFVELFHWIFSHWCCIY